LNAILHEFGYGPKRRLEHVCYYAADPKSRAALRSSAVWGLACPSSADADRKRRRSGAGWPHLWRV